MSDLLAVLTMVVGAGLLLFIRFWQSRRRSRHWLADLLTALGLVALMAAALGWLGRLPWCDCGYINLWYGDAYGSQNSQHLFDPYTFTHLLHGLGFYFLLWLILPRRVPFVWRLLMAVALEASWEVVENTSLVIEYYRAVTASLGYYGDTIINSLGDIATMSLAFILAARFPAWISVVIFVGIEVLFLIWIRDNLTLNILMLLYPIESIKLWQVGIG
ncbi:MAG: DUF2585 family protein [Patescibacteria group bacterium]